jgi:hypothetical protein
MTFTAFRGDNNFFINNFYFVTIIASSGTKVDLQARGATDKPI